MKRFLSLAFTVAMGNALFAQTIVSTSPMNRAAVLEEFTGVNCQFCPDGHKRANDAHELNPTSVLINIHSGVYANTTPDYRTAYGAAIDGQSGLTGYPAGTVSREAGIAGVTYMSTGGTAMNRGFWQGALGTVGNETSPVNVAIDPSYNSTTNEVSILVEVYYTSATDSVDYLNVAVLQSNIKGPQIAAETYYPEMMYADGDYNHNHMLRDLLTGQWGLPITPNGAGFFWDSTFVFTLPASYGAGIATAWEDMSIAAFMADDQQYIYTGVDEYLVEDDQMWNLSATVDYAGGADFCADTVMMEVEVTNNGTTTISAFDMPYAVNGGSQIVETFTGSLAPSASTSFNIEVVLNPGQNAIAFEKFDNVLDNNGDELYNPTAAGFLEKPESAEALSVEDGVEPPVAEDFESVSAGSAPENLYVLAGNGTFPFVVNQSYATWITNAVGGHGESENSLWFGIGYSSIAAGTEFSVTSNNYDFSNYLDAELEFAYAYGQLTSGESTLFTVDVSTDCGATWTTEYSESGDALNTAGVDNASIIMPEEDEWADVEVDMTAYAGETSVMVKFTVVKDAGNSFYLDDINTSGTIVGTEEVENTNISVFPNPTSGLVQIAGIEGNTTADVYDLNGRLVLSAPVNGNALDISALSAGMYTVKIADSKSVVYKKISVLK